MTIHDKTTYFGAKRTKMRDKPDNRPVAVVEYRALFIPDL